MPQSSHTAYTEIGCPGPSPAEYLRTFIPPEQLFPPRPGTSWETHHAYKAWIGSTWLDEPTIEHYFGVSPDLETLVARGQWLQCEGYKCIFEEARRQKPACAMALNWCYNEPWPTAANNSLINWPAKPKPAYHAVAAACRPSLASSRIPRFSWREGELFSVELWLLHDAPRPLPAGRVEAYLQADDAEQLLLVWDFPEAPPNTNLPGPVIRQSLPRFNSDRITLGLRVPGHSHLDSHYTLQYRPVGAGSPRPRHANA
jgi:beta-mannosidase